MRYKVLDRFKAKTSQGDVELQTGQIITLPKDKAIKLLNEYKITPVEKVVYKVYSEVLQAYLWVVDTDEDMHSLRSKGIIEPIYTGKEIEELKKLPKKDLKELHKIKNVFPKSIVQKINIGEKR